MRLSRWQLPLATGLLLAPGAALAQGFSSGSDGSDGALNVAGGQGVVVFDPAALGIDGDGDRVFHFTTVSVGAGTTLRFPASTLGEGRPIVWLASGQVTIDGTLDLNGANGASGAAGTLAQLPTEAGAGGFAGGPGGTALVPPRAGSGPGGGGAESGKSGGGGGHVSAGSPTTATVNIAAGGAAYGNVFLLPALGGSGGGGGSFVSGAGAGGAGGGGGGAIVIASSTAISVAGQIQAKGGMGGAGGTISGGGSGGAIRLIAPVLSGTSRLDVSGALGSAGTSSTGSAGRIRLEAFQQGITTNLFPASSVTYAGPGSVFLPPDAPTVRVTAVGGVAVSPTPTGSFVTPDVVINASAPVSLDLAATNIPPGTQVRITLVPENGSSLTIVSGPLAGTLASSTATAGPITIPSGFTRFFVSATWTP